MLPNYQLNHQNERRSHRLNSFVRKQVRARHRPQKGAQIIAAKTPVALHFGQRQ
jgi:hypothetical protein